MRWVDVFVDVPAESADATAAFWAAALDCEVSPPWDGHPEFVSLTPHDGDGFAHVQTIDGPPRVHIDVGNPSVDSEADRLAGLGASRSARHENWQVMQSPGGLAFCVCGGSGETRPGAVEWPGGHRSRLKQISIDAPPAVADAEFDFWRAATGWTPQESDSPEFDGHLLAPVGGSVKFLLQRLAADDDDPRMHIDLASSDIDAEVARLVGLGAQPVRPERGWYVMRDPAGLEFCVTGQDPDGP